MSFSCKEDRRTGGGGEGEQCVRFNQVCKKKPSRPLTAELKRTRRQVFANSWAQILRFLEVHTICCSVPGESEGGGLEQTLDSMVWGIPWVALEENVPLPRIHLGEAIFHFQGQGT